MRRTVTIPGDGYSNLSYRLGGARKLSYESIEFFALGTGRVRMESRS